MTTFSFNYFGATITARSLGVGLTPPLDQTITAHCIPLTDDGKIIAVEIVNRGVDLPGGHIEAGETAETAMLRETYEEAYVKVEQPILVDVWRLSSDDDRIGLVKRPYLLVYAAKVMAIDDFIPNDEVSKRLTLTPEEFVARYFGDKQQAEKLVSQAVAALG